MSTGQYFFRFFRDSAASNDMAVDGSSTAVPYTVVCPQTGAVELVRINAVIVDGGIKYGEFGGMGAALTNGLEIKAFSVDDTEVFDFLDGETIKTNEDWGALAGVDNVSFPAAGDDSFPVRWTIAKSGASVQLTPGDYLRVLIQDDLTGLTKFTMMAQGKAL